MERPTLDDKHDALRVILDEVRPGHSRSACEAVLSRLYILSRTLHRLYEADCNTGLGETQQAALEATEKAACAIANGIGLSLYLNSDPRGNPIGILTPKSGRYNTMGGRECGWRL